MKLKVLSEILIIDILTVLLVIFILVIPSTVARIIIGLPFFLFFPGYTFVSTFVVKKRVIGNIELLALSVGMSIVVVALIGFALNYTIWGIRLDPVLYSIAVFIFFTSAITLIRRAQISKINVITSGSTFNLLAWNRNRFNASLYIVLIIAITSVCGILLYAIAAPKIGERYSEFYILGIDGKAEDYPTEYDMNNGQIIRVVYGNGTIETGNGFGIITLGIINHQQKPVAYQVKMTINGTAVNIEFGGKNYSMLGPIELAQGETWENELGIIPQHTGDNQKVELSLFEDNATTTEYTLHFWIDVKQTGG